MFDDVKPSELVCLIDSEKFQSLKTFNWYLINLIQINFEQSEHGDPAHEVPGDDGSRPGGVPCQPHQGLVTAGHDYSWRRHLQYISRMMNLTVLHENWRRDDANDPASSVNSNSINRIIYTQAEN